MGQTVNLLVIPSVVRIHHSPQKGITEKLFSFFMPLQFLFLQKRSILFMLRRINNLSNGSFLEFDSGCFDGWCVFVTNPGTKRFAPTDVHYFTRLKVISEMFGPRKVYDDFVVIYNRTSKNIDPKVFDLILVLSKFYDDNSAEIELWFNVLYAGMIAEENKENAILKKRIKRLGVHQVLIDGISPEMAAVFSKGKKWKELDEIMKSKGF